MQIAPSIGLEQLIRHFLIYYPFREDLPMRFFSDGSPGIVIPLENSTLPFLGEQALRCGEFIVYGIMEHFINIAPPPACGMLVIVLQPYALGILSRVPSQKLTNRVIRFTDLFGFPGYLLQESVRNINHIPDLIQTLEDHFFEMLEQLPSADYFFIKSLQEMQRRNGKPKITELLRYLPVSERQLERKFRYYVGISPKKFNGILQMNHYLKTLRIQKNPYTLIQAAIETGFYDQAHLNNKFKSLTGTTPLKYLTAADPLAINLLIQIK